MRLAVIGSPEFTVGFQLAGITLVKDVGEDIMKDVEDIKNKGDIGVVVIEEKTLASLGEHDRKVIEDSVEPVFISLSTEATQDNLRKMIKKSIGVDLWKE